MRQITDYSSLLRENDWTEAFRAAVSDIRKDGGGTLTVPPGVYGTRSIELTGDMTLNVESGAVIRFSDDMDAYERVTIDFEGYPHEAAMPLVYARNARNVVLTGGGTLDGNGFKWWKAHREHRLSFARPYLVCFDGCENVRAENLTLINSPVWTVHPLSCDRVTLRGLTIRNPADSPNTDGIDPDYSTNVLIDGCLIDVGDDCIAIKSGTEEATIRRATENVVISNCHMLNGHGALVLGSEMSGDVRNVTLSNCVFRNTDRGLRVKTRRGRGGRVSGVTMNHVVMDGVMCPFVINMRYYCGKGGKESAVSAPEALPFGAGTPAVSDIFVSDVVCRGCASAAGFIEGLPESAVERVRFSNVSVSMRPGAEKRLAAMTASCQPTASEGFFVKCAREIDFSNVTLLGAIGEPLRLLADASARWNGEPREV